MGRTGRKSDEIGKVGKRKSGRAGGTGNIYIYIRERERER